MRPRARWHPWVMLGPSLAILVVFFLRVVSEDWVRLCAEAYADRLVGAAYLLAQSGADGS